MAPTGLDNPEAGLDNKDTGLDNRDTGLDNKDHGGIKPTPGLLSGLDNKETGLNHKYNNTGQHGGRHGDSYRI